MEWLYLYTELAGKKMNKDIEIKPKTANPDPRHKELERDGYSIHYFITGKNNEEAILFLHPAFGDHKTFDRQIEYFAKNYRVITMDLLGHGLSQVRKSNDKIDESIQHIAEILQKEGLQKAHVVGVSMGSLIAQFFALNFKEKVLSLTVLGGYDISTNNDKVIRAQRRENLRWIWKAMISMDSFRRYVARVTVADPLEQVHFYDMSRNFTRRSFKVMSGLGKILHEREKPKRPYPLLILCGERDLEIARKAAMEWHDSEPESEYRMLKGAGHCANMDKADDFNRILSDFIQKTRKI